MDDDVAGIPLAEFVEALRDELREAQRHADPRFPIEVGPVSVEFTLMTRQEREGKAGVRFWVVEAGATGKLAHESTQKVTIELSPLGPGGTGRARIRDVEERRVPEGRRQEGG